MLTLLTGEGLRGLSCWLEDLQSTSPSPLLFQAPRSGTFLPPDLPSHLSPNTSLFHDPGNQPSSPGSQRVVPEAGEAATLSGDLSEMQTLQANSDCLNQEP